MKWKNKHAFYGVKVVCLEQDMLYYYMKLWISTNLLKTEFYYVNNIYEKTK